MLYSFMQVNLKYKKFKNSAVKEVIHSNKLGYE